MDPSTRKTPGLALLRGAASGEPEAVDAWFRGEHPDVYRLCFGFLADAAEAEDVAQDAMLHLLDKLEGWDPDRPYHAWRDTVVLNLCRDRMRRNAARSRAHSGAAEAREQRDEDCEHPSRSEPVEELERREVQAILTASLADLTPREREVFVLRDLEERSTREVSDCLAVTESTVRTLLTLARRRLRGILADRLPGGTIGGEHV